MLRWPQVFYSTNFRRNDGLIKRGVPVKTKYLIALVFFITPPASANFSVMFTVCRNLISDGKTVDVTPGSSYSMSCIESKNKRSFRCNIKYNNNTSIESTYIKNVDPSGRVYFGTKDGSENYQVYPQLHSAMSVVRISTTTMLGSRVCSGDYMTEQETKEYLKSLKEKENEKKTEPDQPSH
jgi:hypothetical protein